MSISFSSCFIYAHTTHTHALYYGNSPAGSGMLGFSKGNGWLEGREREGGMKGV
jgi:hypothetical protein